MLRRGTGRGREVERRPDGVRPRLGAGTAAVLLAFQRMPKIAQCEVPCSLPQPYRRSGMGHDSEAIRRNLLGPSAGLVRPMRRQRDNGFEKVRQVVRLYLARHGRSRSGSGNGTRARFFLEP